MKVVGVTGNSGSGKSVISAILLEFGGFIIDADKIAHSVLLNGNRAYGDIIDNFGAEILNSDNEINRKKLGEIVFSDEALLKKLNEITHKHIVEEIKERVGYARKSGSEFIVIDAPLLIETGLDKICDEIWLVYADKEKRIERIMARDNISRNMAEARINSQTSFDELKKYASLVIDNTDKTYEELKKEIINLISANKKAE